MASVTPVGRTNSPSGEAARQLLLCTAAAGLHCSGNCVKPLTDLAHPDSFRENKLSLVERLADDLAHEIKNPLHSMVINLEVLRRRLARLEGGSEELLRYAGVLGSELERVNRRVDLLLRIARPGPVSEDVSTLAEIMEELLEILEIECDQRQLDLDLDLPISATRARTHRGEARQIVLSFALFMIDRLPRGSTLAITSGLDAEYAQVFIRGHDGSGAPAIVDLDADPEAMAALRSIAEQTGAKVSPTGSGYAGAPDLQTSGGVAVFLPREGV